MKDRQGKKLTHKELAPQARTVVARPESAALICPEPYQAISPHVRELACQEWMRWAQALVDRPLAAAPENGEPPDRDNQPIEKPGREEWIRWAQVVVDRLTTCACVYSKPPYEDVFMQDKDRQTKNGKTLDLLRRIHRVTDEADTPTDSLTDLEHHDERVIAGLNVLLRETLDVLPELSADMQHLLKSPWINNCNGRLADELFRGPLGYEPEGIGSGSPIHGRLPEALLDLLEREGAGQGRHMREALPGPHAPHDPRWQDDTYRRLVEENSRISRFKTGNA